MKERTKLSLMIWGVGVLAEVIYALILVIIAKAFDIVIDKMFYYITSSLILSVCLYFDKFHMWQTSIEVPDRKTSTEVPDRKTGVDNKGNKSDTPDVDN